MNSLATNFTVYAYISFLWRGGQYECKFLPRTCDKCGHLALQTLWHLKYAYVASKHRMYSCGRFQ